MKAQLLEDIGNNHQLPPPPRSNARAAEPQQQQQQQQPAPPDPPPPPPWAPSQAEMESRYGDENAADAGDWFDRWGRKAASWVAVLVTALALSGTGMWLYNENKVDNTLQVLAKAPIPARQAKPAPVAATTPATPPATATPAIPAEPQLAAPAAAQTPAQAAPHASRGTGETASAEPDPVVEAKAPRARTPSAVGARAAKKATPAQASYSETKSERVDKVSETLRQCRAAGYHAARCVQLGCEATKYGLACKGSASGR